MTVTDIIGTSDVSCRMLTYDTVRMLTYTDVRCLLYGGLFGLFYTRLYSGYRYVSRCVSQPLSVRVRAFGTNPTLSRTRKCHTVTVPVRFGQLVTKTVR
jgi:hypothetical protein